MKLEIIETSRPCALCGARQASVVGTQSRSGAPLRSVACADCGLVRADPLPYDPHQFYAEDYRLAYKQTFEPRPKHVLRAGLVALDRLRRIAPWSGGRLRVLDVGSGGGEFAHLLQLHGHQVTGIEPNRGYADWSVRNYGLTVLRGFAGQVPLESASYDLITMWHVLEHTVDPGEVLRQLRGALKPGGHLVVEVPNVDATCQAPRSTFHEAHLFTFSVTTLRQMAAQAGLTGRHCEFSHDGGNQLQVFERSASAVAHAAAAPAVVDLSGEHARVTSALGAHTPWRHAFTRHPWQRMAARARRMIRERCTLLFHKANGRELLNSLYAQSQSTTRERGASGGRGIPLRWVFVAWILALLAEEGVMDRGLLAPWGVDAPWWPYVGLQAMVIAGLVWLHRAAPRGRADWARLVAWALPMLALPAVC